MNDLDASFDASQKTIVFCEPPYVFWDRTLDKLRKGEETIPGMGVLILAAVARQKGYKVHLIDAKEQGRALEEVALEIAKLKPDYLGLSATTISVTNAARIAARVKDLVPGVVTLVGGAHVSAIPERTLEAFPDLDYGIVGEGEHSMFDLLERLETGTPIESVAGLAYRRDGRIVANENARGLPAHPASRRSLRRDSANSSTTMPPRSGRSPAVARRGRGRRSLRRARLPLSRSRT
jgi:radical SAM superfamily enzyme YgiQ (UPF0313 family)